MSESQLVSAIIKRYYKHPQVFLWRSNAGVFKTFGGSRVQCNFKGLGDITGFLAPNGKFLAIETKDTTKQEESQKEFQAEVESKGGIYIITWDLKTVIDRLTLEGIHG